MTDEDYDKIIDELEDEIADLKARLAKAAEARMSDEPFIIKLEQIKEHENGDATYTFDMSETARNAILEDGLKLMLYCGVSKVDLQDVYDWILAQADKPKQDTPDTIWVDFNEEGAVVAGGAGPARYEGEHTYVKAQGGEDE